MYNNTRISNYISKYLPKRKDEASDCDETSINKPKESITDRKLSTVSPYGSYMEDSHHRQSQQSFKNHQTSTISTIQIRDHEKGMAVIEEKSEEQNNDEGWFSE